MTEGALVELRLRGLGVIADAVVPLGPGFTAVTGETGAGKTMILQALDLVCGGRADAGAVRTGEQRAQVEARVRLAADPEGMERVAQAGGAVDEDGSVVAIRTVSAEGRSRAVLGGVGVPSGVLGEVVGAAVEIHGQNAQQRLLRPAEQRAALDRYAGDEHLASLAGYSQLWQRWRALSARVEELARSENERLGEMELLRHGLERIHELMPTEGEDQALREEISRLTHASDLRAGLVEVIRGLSGDDDGHGHDRSVLSQVSAVRRVLATAAELDPGLADWTVRADEIGVLAAELCRDVAGALASYEADPEALEVAQQRLATLGQLARIYATPAHPGAQGVLRWASEATVQLEQLAGDESSLGGLAKDEAAVREQLAATAAALRKGRQAAARGLAARISEELDSLGMQSSSVVVEVTPLVSGVGADSLMIEGEPVLAGPHGVDEVALLLVSGLDSVPRPLHKGASGGELSRIMLAVEVVFAGADRTPTIVFDEVDAGIGGTAAIEVGRRLARLARDHQVVVVTHLPQVAAYADHHLTVVKDVDGSVTSSGVRLVEGPERLTELARMLAGRAESSSAREHARELLASAQQERMAEL